MRGILLLTLGALLIWVGLRTDRETEAAGPGTGEATVVDRPGEGSLDDGREGIDPRLLHAVTQEEDEGEDEATLPATSPVLEPEPEPVVAVPDPPREQESRDDPPSFELGAPGTDPVEVAELLLATWLDRDPAALEARLNDGERPLAIGQRRLIAAFWQAVVGSPEAAAEEARALEGNPDVTSAEVAMLRAAAEPPGGRPIPASATRRDPLALAMRMVLLEERASQARADGDWVLAARSRSDLIQLELDAPWAPHRAALATWAAELNLAQASHRLHPEGEWPSVEIEVEPGEGLTNVRQRVLAAHPGLKVCVGLIREVNDLGKYVHPGDVLRIPTDLPNVLVDLDARLLVYRHGTEAVAAWEIGIGMEGHETPTGRFEVGEKVPDPPWMPIGGAQLPFGHPDNPLGTRWIAWLRDGVKTSYGFHGTWEPEGVGGRVSQGCVRMHNEAVEVLFEILPVGSEVLVER